MPERVSSGDFLSPFVVTSNAYWYFTAYVVVFLLAPFFNMLIEKMSKEEFKRLLILGFVLLSALFLFTFFLKLNVGKTGQRLLKLISPLVFQVYIIHSHPFVTQKLLSDAFKNLGSASGLKTAAVTLCSAVIIFITCIIIDYLRSLLFKIVKIEKLNDKLFKKIRL